MYFPDDFIESLKDKIPVSQVVGQVVALKAKGAEHQGLCPFHNEKTPSFTVNDSKAFYYCFGCGAKGNAISFLMEYRKLSFVEAVQKLCDDFHITPPPQPNQQAAAHKKQKRNEHLEALTAATSYFQQALADPKNTQQLNYFKQRGLNAKTIAAFQLGYAPHKGLISYLAANHVSLDTAIELGLIKKGDSNYYDAFRHRAIFPICNKRGQVIAFGGRSLNSDQQPKYLNSPEHTLFEKRHTLYNLDKALKHKTPKNHFLVVEGFMDVIALYQAGFKQSVASLGTAFGEGHLQTLWRYDNKPILCFDGDTAGTKALKRAIEIIYANLQPGQSAQFIILPAGEDPDSLLQKDARAFHKLHDTPLDLQAATWHILTAEKNLSSPDDIRMLKKEGLDLLSKIPDETLQALYKKQFKESYEDRFFRATPKINVGFTQKKAGAPKPAFTPKPLPNFLKNTLLGCIYKDPTLVEYLIENQSLLEIFTAQEKEFIHHATDYAMANETHETFDNFLLNISPKTVDFIKQSTTLTAASPLGKKNGEGLKQAFLSLLEEAQQKLAFQNRLSEVKNRLKSEYSSESWGKFKNLIEVSSKDEGYKV